MPKADRVPFSPLALRAARSLTGLSLPELGRRLDVSKQFVAQLEAGERWPNPQMLDLLASITGLERAFFQRSLTGTAVTPDSVYFRCKTRTLVRDRERAGWVLAVYRDLLQRLAQEVNFPALTLPHRSATTEDQVERAAEVARFHLGLGRDGPVLNMVRAVERAGIFTTVLHTDDADIDSFTARGEPCIIVRTSFKGSTSRSRLDVAHELGHLVMHTGQQAGSGEQEEQANRFAFSFLFPRVSFEREFPADSRRLWPELFRLKARWGVSAQSMVMRAHQLGIINDARYRSLMIYASRAGWRRNPEPEEPAPEHAELVPLAFREIHAVRGVRPQTVLAEIGWNERLFSRIVGDHVAADVLGIGAPPPVRLADFGLPQRTPAKP